ncbi:WecB/TagA/CpsF family glycosyltransferase [Teichococcus aestuarii]|uniref:WecB/TagA/CpsF family glycosyltransferase n=1 Tax=Teichococcus aestuarii TaxID=568898 RepID=UPI0015E828E3|nr:WecB/TagA/CpsF family glycosyltransferase [Pseudoroseomonas aestuarii]
MSNLQTVATVSRVESRLADRSATLGSNTRILGIRVDDVPRSAIVARVVDAVRQRQRAYVVNANAHLLTVARDLPWLSELYDGADIAFCDGAGVQLAARLLHGRLFHRTTPPEWLPDVAAVLAPEGCTLYWLGGKPGVVERAAESYAGQTGLCSVGCQHGFFDHRAGSEDNARIVRHINETQPDILLINMGMPLQERWLYDHWHLLEVPVAITAGALVDHAAGHVRRPPRWVANLGLEWAVRLAVEPRRLWRRYMLGLPVFGVHILGELAMKKRERKV